ncbi:bifunctional diaminohydroxyphosphoribosylaminopyrimidine deaminase/5-amino-6-(5-phosphoribosylamino)uracil reductase RibD [Shouchella clausii]
MLKGFDRMHERYMRLALDNAKAMKGQTDPNPLVGCVLVKEGRIIGVGAHLKAGEAHAEINALRMAGSEAKGSTAYVTLEPCSHTGRTGPCAVALVEAGVKEVIIATLDPNPLVSGNGVRILEEGGVHVQTGILEKEAVQLNDVFNYSIVNRMPYVTLKAAVSLDGKIAAKSGDSKWITSSEARQDVHRLRTENQAIIVGVDTVLKDNPSLTARIANGRNPIRVIVDSHLRTPVDSIVTTDGLAPTWIFTATEPKHLPEKQEWLEKAGVRLVQTSGTTKVDLKEMMAYLYKESISSALLEAGGTLNAAFLEAQLVQKLIVYVAPKLIGGALAPTFLEGSGIGKMADALPLVFSEATQIGPDVKLTAYVVSDKTAN